MKDNFEQLYRDHYRRVLGLCRRLLGPSARAEDAAQEVFVRAYRAIDRYDAAQPFAPWVLRIASNYCVDVVRRSARDPAAFGCDEAELHAIESGEPPAPDALLAAERADEVRAAVEALPGKYRVPLVLAYYNESSYAEIAEALGITRNHVGTLILRAKHSLRRALDAKRQGDDR